MLGKLLKYEWKSIGRLLPLIYLAVLVLSLCVGASFRNNLYMDDGFGSLIFLSIYIILVVALVVVTIIVIIERFFRSMISQEGYLMHTLPVKPWQHITSKALMAILWTAIAVAVLIVSFLLIAGTSGLWAEMRSEGIFSLVIQEIEYVLKDGTIALLIICTIIQLIRVIMQLYLAMAIGGAATKNKVLFSFVAFVVLAVIVTLINSIVGMGMFMSGLEGIEGFMTLTATAEEMETVNAFMSGAFGVQMITDGVLLVVFFILTNYFLKKRLNLE